MGQPKAWLPFACERLLQRVVRIVSTAVERVVVVAAPGQELPELPCEVTIVRDECEGQGPLQGLASGLAALEGSVHAVCLASCDAPFLRPEFVQRVVSHIGLDLPTALHEIAVPRVGDRLHPLAAAYRPSVLPHIQRLLREGQRRMTVLFDAMPTRTIEARELEDVDPHFESLLNLNSPQDYDAALRLLEAKRSV
jgi:molybdopterin-guanine dinucleotide biosynthesis protein A